MKSKRIGKGVVFRTFIEADDQDAQFAQHEQREWDDPLSPAREQISYWSNWLAERSLPAVGLVAVSDDLVWNELMPGGPETVMTAYQYLQRRFGALSDEALAGKVTECAFIAFSPKEKWGAAGYDVRHKSEAAFRMACMFELGWVLKELELRTTASQTGAKSRSLEDDLDLGVSSYIGIKFARDQKAAKGRKRLKPLDDLVKRYLTDGRKLSGPTAALEAIVHHDRETGRKDRPGSYQVTLWRRFRENHGEWLVEHRPDLAIR